MSYYIIFIICFVYCVINNLMSVVTYGHEPSTILLFNSSLVFPISDFILLHISHIFPHNMHFNVYFFS
jgi:hypothetical protein